MAASRWKLPCLALLLSLAGCDEELRDTSFDLDCRGGCAWEVEEGRTRKVATWNEHDEALELVDSPTTVSQLVAGSLACGINVEVFGQIGEGADFSVAIDADDDGTIDDEVTLEELDWQHTRFFLAADADDSWRIILRKRGTGKVVLGTVSAERECY